MYPTKLVHKLINKYTSKGNTIYDPFSGRGTTLLKDYKKHDVMLKHNLK